MATKIGAKELVRGAGVATLPSLTLDETGPLPDDAALAELGWPLLVKASAGGGGRGMRVVAGASDLADAVAGARREATAAFGDGTVFLERLVRAPRHIEVQIIADSQGDVVALFERDCSVQRRHQKVIEESPSPVVGPELRAQLSEQAVATARAVGYVNAGTVEFVLETEPGGEDRAYFLEMNTRLQVEHPVTEAVTGLDLVRLQLLVAQGQALPPEVHRAAAVGPQGHAVEAHLYAEDPSQGWLPQTGSLVRFEIGRDQPDVRVDSGVASGSVVTPYYDPMLAKVVVHAPTRHEAVSRLAGALAGARIHGLVTNRDLLVRVLHHPEFAAGSADTGFIERIGLDGPGGLGAPLADDSAVQRHAVAAALAGRATRRAAARVQATIPAGFRNNPSALQEVTFEVGSREITIGYGDPPAGARAEGHVLVEVDGKEFGVDTVDAGPDRVRLTVEGIVRTYLVEHADGLAFVDGPDGSSTLTVRGRFPDAEAHQAQGSALAPMHGGVVRVLVAPGDRVTAGDVLVVLEAMKMEHAVHAPVSGRVAEVDVAVGDQVEAGRLLALVQPDDPDGADAG
ncbi:MAG: hypothetical protein JO368_03125 [Acidimicrobiales bacterium]|nr:hypothetical protein [Acidimicrobiales bacterium]